MQKGVAMTMLLCLGIGAMAADKPLRVVESVDAAHYMGRWYSIASIPSSFERQCVEGTTAEYTLLANGRIQVVNTCYDTEGNPDVARGQAWIPDLSESSKVKVSFVRFIGMWWFGAPYWIIDLAPDYSYAVAGIRPESTDGFSAEPRALPTKSYPESLSGWSCRDIDLKRFD